MDKWMNDNWSLECPEQIPVKKKMKYIENFLENGTEDSVAGEANMECAMVWGHSYVPWQMYEQAFPPGEALMKGTLFPELYGVYPIPE